VYFHQSGLKQGKQFQSLTSSLPTRKWRGGGYQALTRLALGRGLVEKVEQILKAHFETRQMDLWE
jgi:hypothetical protein